MEMDEMPNTFDDVGGSGDANEEQNPPVSAVTDVFAIDAQSIELESLKKEKAELGNEIFTLQAELDHLKDQYSSVIHSKSQLEERYDGIVRQSEERTRLFRQLQVTYEGLLAQKGADDQECVNVKRERDDKELLLKRVNKEKQLIAVEVQSLKEQLKDLNTQRKEYEMQRRAMEKAQSDARMEYQRSVDEKAVYEESKKWFMNELTDRDNKIAQLRLNHSGKEVAWQNERMRLVDEKCAAMNEVEDIKVDLAMKQRLIDEANERMKGIGDSHDAQVTTLKDELASRECLNRTLREQIRIGDETVDNLKSSNDYLHALIRSTEESAATTEMDKSSQIEECNRSIEQRDRTIAELKDELEKANELLKNKHNLNISDEAIEELSPAAAVASRLIKSGGSLTAIYREHAKLAAQLEEERAKSRLTEESFQEVIGQLTERAPQLIQQKEQLEKYMDENYRLEIQLNEADSQRRKLMEERDMSRRELAFSKAELERVQRESAYVEKRMVTVLFALDNERKKNGRVTPGADDENAEEDDTTIRDIKSLVRRNAALEGELAQEKARSHEMARTQVAEATERLVRERNEMHRELEMQKTQCNKLETVLDGKEQTLQSYKNVIEGGGLGGESVIVRRQLEQKTSELNDANMKIQRLEEWRRSEKEEKDKLMNVYEERIKQHMVIVNEVKRANGKLESEFELQKQTALETYKELEKQTRKLERAIENEQKARENCIAAEQKITGLHERLMEIQAEVASMRVEKRSLNEELKMSQANGMRIKAELESRMQNSYHNEMMLTMMGDMEARMNAVESSKKEAMEMKLESLENERDQLKTSNASLAERNERLERERGADLTKLNAEKASLESQFNSERNERMAAENEANELRAKLVATHKYFAAVDDSIGLNPERLAQECQKLKNDNKFLEGQMEEMKKRAEVADSCARRAEEELTRLTALSSTVESTLVESTLAGSIEQERLKGMLEAEEMKSMNLNNDVITLKDTVTSLENAAYQAKNTNDSIILNLEQKISVLEMQLREESAKGIGFDDKLRESGEEKAIVERLLNEVNETLIGVRGELEEIRIEKEAAAEKVGVLETEKASIEGIAQEDANKWIEERMRLEGEYNRLKMESDGDRERYTEDISKKEEQINKMMSMAREVDGSSMEVEGMSQMSAVNRYQREELQRQTERMMRAEVEAKRLKVQSDELERERTNLEKAMKDLQTKSEADANALSAMADLRVKLETSMRNERELLGIREEKERLTKHVNELQNKVNVIGNEKAKLMGTVKAHSDNIGMLTNDNGVKMREIVTLKKNIQEKEEELVRVKAELSKKGTEGPPVGGPRSIAHINQLKTQLETSRNELITAKKELEDANAKCANLKQLAIKFRKERDDASSSSTAVIGEMGENASEGVIIKRLQEEKDEMEKKMKEINDEKDSIERERDEIKFRQSSMSSMLDKTKKHKEMLENENENLKRRIMDMGGMIEEKDISAPQSTVVSPSKNLSSPIKAVQSISSASISQSTSDVPILTTPATTPSVTLPSPSNIISNAVERVIPIAAPSDPSPPATSTNIFQSTPMEWPVKMSNPTGASTSSTLGGHPPLFGRSAPPSVIPRTIPDVTTSTSIPEVPSLSMELKGEEEQPISSSGDSRKRGANDERMEMKKPRIEEEEDDGDNDIITSSHRGNELEDVMVEDDTRDGDGDGGDNEERREGEEEEDAILIEDEGEESRGLPVDYEEDDVDDDDVVEVGDEENDEEEDSQRDDEMDDPDDEDEIVEIRGEGRIRNRIDEGVDDDDGDDDGGEDEEEEEGEEGEEGAVSDDDEDEEEEEEGNEMDRGSESDGEVEGDGDIHDRGNDGDEGREAIPSMDDEADEEGIVGENTVMKSESSEGEKKKRSPIVWSREEQEECSSSNESGRPSTSSVWRGGVRGRGGGPSRVPRVPRQPDLATNLMRMNRGRGVGGGQRGKRGGI